MTTVDIVTVENKKLFALELAIILVVFVGERRGWIPVSKTVLLLGLALASLLLRGFRLRDVGLARPASWTRAIGIGLAAGVAMSALDLFVTQPVLVGFTGQEPNLADMAGVRGNAGAFAATVVIIWLLGAFGEELVYRGYMMTRFARMMSGERGAWIVSLVVVSLLFGFGHNEQGITGMLENVINGLVLGGLYLATGRNLVAPILAHGVAKTIDLTLIFLGTYPGM
jgi:membrane protease YdiL (CAAX protease family)